MPLLGLPNELLLLVAENLKQLKNMSSFLRANRRLASLLTPLLHRCAMEDVGPLSALQWAVWKGHETLARILLDKGVDIDYFAPRHIPSRSRGGFRNARGDRTALYCAVDCQNLAMVKLLLDKGADVNLNEPGTAKPLHAAVYHCNRVMVEILLDNGADTECLDMRGYTPLLCAVIASQYTLVCLLLERGADISRRYRGEVTVLHWAVLIARAKLEQIARVRFDWGATPHVKVIEHLIEMGVDVAAENMHGSTVIDDMHLRVSRSNKGKEEVRELKRILYRGVAYRRWKGNKIVFPGWYR